MASYEQAKALLPHSVSRPTLYSMELKGTPVAGPTPLTEEETKYIQLFCNNISFPGLDYEQVISLGQEAMGIQRSTPAGMLFGDGNRLRFTVIENSNFGVYKSLRTLFNAVSAKGANPEGNNRAQRMAYYDDYVFKTILRKLEFPNSDKQVPSGGGVNQSDLDHGYKVISTFEFDKCFISSIGPVVFDTDTTNTYTTFTATMKFESYYHDDRPYMYGDSPV